MALALTILSWIGVVCGVICTLGLFLLLIIFMGLLIKEFC